jgi:hypothetical protein
MPLEPAVAFLPLLAGQIDRHERVR